MKCTVADCERSARTRGWCKKHYERWRKHGDPLVVLTHVRAPRVLCRMDACDVPIHDRASKLCKRHHYFLKKWGDPDPISREIRIRKTRSITKQGYVVLRMPEHPNAHPKNKRVFEHVVAMSEMIGRPLRKGESVHHKNNIKDDNRTENLELWVTHQPSGARVEDLVEWARNFISSYGKDAA